MLHEYGARHIFIAEQKSKDREQLNSNEKQKRLEWKKTCTGVQKQIKLNPMITICDWTHWYVIRGNAMW